MALVPLSEKWPERPFAIAPAHELRHDRPLGLTRFGQRLVLFRDAEGVARAAHAACPHRGADLSLGRVVNGQLACGYHGFQFDSAGECQLVPCQSADAPISKALRLRTLAVHEEHGFLWMTPSGAAWDGAIPWLDTMPERSGQTAYTSTVWRARLSRSVEAMLDFHHVAFAHRRYLAAYRDIQEYEAHVEGEHVLTRGVAAHERHPTRRFEGELSVAFPASVYVGLGGKVHGAVVLCPIDAERTWIGVRYLQTYVSLPLIGRLLTELTLWSEMRFIQPDDQRISESIEPRSSEPHTNHLVAADRGTAEWHRLRRRVLQGSAETTPHEQAHARQQGPTAQAHAVGAG
ncbi:MAG: Rieske 2Fe-2S domain-containing protein [Myxococcales bacterium]|nr:Rieske 2Fe-2S domain-containing protein [Myxococcales bacterium]